MEFLNKLLFVLRYLGRPPWDTGISPPELIDLIENTQPGSALDLGCGTGTNVTTLSKHGWRVTGIDFVGKAIREAEKKAARAGVEATFIIGDVTDISLLEYPYDLVLDIGCFHSLDKTKKLQYIQNLKRLVSQKGIFLVYGWMSNEEKRFPGITDTDIESIKDSLRLIDVITGTERGEYPAVWMKFEKMIDGK